MTNAVTAGRPAGTPIAPPTPEQARSTWPRLAALGAALLVLGGTALIWADGGPRLLLAALGVFGVARGAAVLRRARSSRVDRTAAVSAAGAVWFGLLAVAVALLSAVATGWVLLAGVVVLLPVLAAASPTGRRVLAGAGVVVVLGAVALGVAAGTDTLLSTGRTVAAVLVAALGLANLGGAVGMARIARRPAPAPAAGCGGCACGAGGCGS